MARLELPNESSMTEEQRSLCDRVAAGPRGKIPAPMIAWIHNPELADCAQKLGEVVRFHTVLDPKLTELAILYCAARWSAAHVWKSHRRHAVNAGISVVTIDAIKAGERPHIVFPLGNLVLDFSRNLFEEGRVDDGLYAEAESKLGVRGVVELVTLLGYYSLVCFTANAFELGLDHDVGRGSER